MKATRKDDVLASVQPGPWPEVDSRVNCCRRGRLCAQLSGMDPRS